MSAIAFLLTSAHFFLAVWALLPRVQAACVIHFGSPVSGCHTFILLTRGSFQQNKIKPDKFLRLGVFFFGGGKHAI